MLAAQGAFCTQKYKNDSKNVFSHSRILRLALSKVRGNSSNQGERLEGEAPRRYNLEQTSALGHLRIWDTLGFAAEQVCSNRYH